MDITWDNYFYQATTIEVKGMVAQLDNKLLSGDDQINNVIIKTSLEVVIQYLVFLIKFFIQRWIFPKELA